MAAALPTAAFLFLLLPLPAPPLALPPTASDRSIAIGAFHVHTNRSDGSGSPDDVAAAAARAGLQFVILSDHGDGTREPDPPQYRSGVLIIDGVELSTAAGHYVAIGLPRAPYPLRGEARDVAEDVRRLGGFGVVAHPDSARPALRWHDWIAPVDAVEWLNADAEWRDESKLELARALVRYPVRPIATLASLLDRPDTTLSRWDALTRHRPVVALAGGDAHARTGWADEDANRYRSGWFVRFPGYEMSFRTFALRALLDRPFDRVAAADASQLIAAVRSGRVYSVIDAVASPATLAFSAATAGRTVTQGERLVPAGAVALTARVPGAGGTIVLRRDGTIVAQHPMPSLEFRSSAPGTYRVEVYLAASPGDPPVPWIVSNPIYVHPSEWGSPPATLQPPATDSLNIQGGPWHLEKDPRSMGEIAHSRPPTGEAELTYTLAPGDRAGQYAALVISVGTGLVDRTRLAFQAHATQAMRISVQARRPRSGERWQRSIYVDTVPREIVIPFSDLTPVGTSTAPFDPKAVDTVLFVVDTTNTLPGASGRVAVGGLRVER
jgi:hypothetical protein